MRERSDRWQRKTKVTEAHRGYQWGFAPESLKPRNAGPTEPRYAKSAATGAETLTLIVAAPFKVVFAGAWPPNVVKGARRDSARAKQAGDRHIDENGKTAGVEANNRRASARGGRLEPD